MRGRSLLALLSLLALGSGLLVTGRTDAAFHSAPGNGSSSFSVAPDFVAPTVVRTRAADPWNAPSYGLRRCRFYQAYAEVTDSGNPASGVATVEADLTGLSGGAGLESLVAGSYTLDGIGYGYRSLPRLVTVAAGSTSYSLLVADLDANSGQSGDYPVTVAAGSPVSAVFLTGLEQGVASSSAPGVFDAVVGSGVSAHAATVRSGSYALQVAPANAAAYAAVTGLGGSTAVVRFAVRLGALPGDTVNLFAVIPSGGSTAYLVYNAATGRLGVRWGAGAINDADAAAGAGAWYVIEMRVSLASPHTLEWRVGGVEQTGASSAESARTVSSIQFGTMAANVTYTAFFDDALVSLTSADYPLGNGRVLSLAVDGSGTHNGANRFRNDDGTGIDGTSPGRLDEIPQTSAADYVRQSNSGATRYLEFTFADTSEPCINAVAARLAYHSAGTSANNGKASIFNGAAESVIFSGDMSVTTLAYARSMVSAGGGAWTAALVSGLVARVGYSSDVNPEPYWDALMLEYDVPISW